MDKNNTNKLFKTLLLASVFTLPGCTTLESFGIDVKMQQTPTNRRIPANNPDNISTQNAQLEQAKKNTDSIKRSDQEYDVYQHYQSNNPPISLRELRELKRRPVLNAKELNDLMDQHHPVPSTEKSAAPVLLPAPRIDASANLQQIIQYNKQQHAKPAAPAVIEPVVQTVKVEAPSSTRDKSIEETGPSIEQPSAKAEEIAVAPAITSEPEVKPLEQPKIAIPEPVKVENESKEIEPSAITAPATMPSTPTAPAAPAKDVASMSQADLEKMLKEKFSQNKPRDLLGDTPVTVSRSQIAEETSNAEGEPPSPQEIKPSVIPQAIAKFAESPNDSRLSQLNLRLLEYYHNLKEKIAIFLNLAEE